MPTEIDPERDSSPAPPSMCPPDQIAPSSCDFSLLRPMSERTYPQSPEDRGKNGWRLLAGRKSDNRLSRCHVWEA
jgi:hypothetical protein